MSIRDLLAQLRAAQEKAAQGGQGLFVRDAIPGWPAPACFRRAKRWGYLFDQDTERLLKTARAYGVRVLFIHRKGTPTQHIDLCSKPLERAIAALGSTPKEAA